MFLTYYAKLIKQVDKSLKALMKDQIDSVKNNSFLQFFYGKIEDFLFSGGKRIRPIMMITAFSAVNPDKSKDEAIKTSLSLELIHNASLIHDDIMDNANTRRGKQAFHKVFYDFAEKKHNHSNLDYANYGESMGILGGDYAYNLAYKAIHNDGFPPAVILRAAQEFNAGFLDIVQGVIYESELMGRKNVSEAEYVEMIRGKTAALFEKSARLGAILAEGSETQIDSLGNFALNVGIAFQLVDDIIGTFGDAKKTGKPVDSDIKEGKKTILVIKALENANEEQKLSLSRTLGNRDATATEVEEVRDIMKLTGALQYAQNKAEELYQLSQSYLENTDSSLNQPYKDYLLSIAKMGVYREK
ncbi:MAG: polyprenyl synthetase family protein [Candidatus Heimdallarchaeota archaeon]|nr:polyprenyl synthetase family protein [Candidatus Heimdallarchaeota archaeon]